VSSGRCLIEKPVPREEWRSTFPMTDVAAHEGCLCIRCGSQASNPMLDMPPEDTYVGEPWSEHTWLCGPGSACYDQRGDEER
jgi:hypothetical protein